METEDRLNSFETLLAEKSEAMDNRVVDRVQNKVMDPLTADKSASLDDFIEMVGRIVSQVLREECVEFELDEGKRLATDPNFELNNPYITYNIIERKASMELKPRERESFIQEKTFSQTDARQGRVYGQKFKAKVQFNIFASEYKVANRVMNIFEDLIFNYKHYFKKNGVAELLFEKHLTDVNYDIYRQHLSVRNIIYYVEVEKLHVMFDTEIDKVLIK